MPGNDAGDKEQVQTLARIRHDLCTPLNAIIGYGEMLLEDAPHGDSVFLSSSLGAIVSAGRQVLALVRDQLNEHRLRVLPPATGIAELLSKLQSSIEPSTQVIKERTQALMQDPDYRADPLLSTDLATIMLAANRLETTLREAQEGPPRDRGFDPADFSRPSATKAVAGERGLGRILVVDDNEVSRRTLARILEREGFSVAGAENGVAALAILAQENIDLILLDILMPEMDGFELLKKLKADRDHRRVPVVMISALEEAENIARCIEMGAEDYLPKVFNPILLQARINASLEKKRMRDQEILYLEHVAALTNAAEAVQSGSYHHDAALQPIAARDDGLGNLAKVFQRMVQQFYQREQQLKQQLETLQVEIDETRKKRQVAELTETEYFESLKQTAKAIRKKRETKTQS